MERGKLIVLAAFDKNDEGELVPAFQRDSFPSPRVSILSCERVRKINSSLTGERAFDMSMPKMLPICHTKNVSGLKDYDYSP